MIINEIIKFILKLYILYLVWLRNENIWIFWSFVVYYNVYDYMENLILMIVICIWKCEIRKWGMVIKFIMVLFVNIKVFVFI